MCESDVGERVVWDRSGCKSVVCPRHAWETVCVKELRVKELCGTEVCAKEWCKNVLCVKVLYVQVLWMWWVIMLCSHNRRANNRRANTMSRGEWQPPVSAACAMWPSSPQIGLQHVLCRCRTLPLRTARQGQPSFKKNHNELP